MRISLLEAFVEVAKYNSMSIAAEKLFISQQGISKAIMTLEAELNAKLFVRTNNGVFLTKQGEFILDDAKTMIELDRKIRNEIGGKQQQYEELNGTLRLYVAIPLSPLIRKLVDLVLQDHPKIKISLIELFPKYLSESIPTLNAEICISSILPNQLTDLIAKCSNYNIFQLKEDTFYLYANKDSPLAHKKRIHFKELENIPFVCHMHPDQPQCLISDLFEIYGIPFNPVFSSSQLHYCLSYLQNGKAYYISSPMAMGSYKLDNIAAIPFKEKISSLHILLISKEIRLSPEAQAFIGTVKQYFQDSFYQII